MKLKSVSAQLKFFCAVLIFISAVACSTSTTVFPQTNQPANPPFSLNTSPLPAPTGFINDYAGVIDAATKQQLEQKIKSFKETSNPPVELAVAIVKTTGERPIFDYSLAVSRGWKIGSKADDNPSALLFIAIDDRKYFTQVSKDLEDELPDGITGSLQRQNLVPAFKQGDYGKGINDTIDAYIQTIRSKQDGSAPPVTTSNTQSDTTGRRSGSSSGTNIVTCLIILFILMIIIFSRRGGGGGGRNNRWGGGGFGGGGSALPWIIGGILSSGGSSSSSSGSWGGGSSGGSDWGGFGGGGDFGGGGAGGDW